MSERSPSAAKERADCECDRLGLPPDAECVRDIPCTRVSWPTDSPVAADRLPDPAPVQVACDRCTQGAMDSTNPHLTGECGCECNALVSAAVSPAEPREREIVNFVCRNRSVIFHALNLAATSGGVTPEARAQYREARDTFAEVTRDAD